MFPLSFSIACVRWRPASACILKSIGILSIYVGRYFGDRAKQLVIVLLAFPSYDLVASLLMLSWYEFGCNRDVGFWMYTGMAIRMAEDLGMHKISEHQNQDDALQSGPQKESGHSDGQENPGKAGEGCWNEFDLRLNLFWSIYFIDRIISLGKIRRSCGIDEGS